MPRRRNNKKRKGAAAEGSEDRIGALPDALLHHVLSFLPSHEAVRSCVLSRRWRDLWKSAPVLRITDADSWGSPAEFNKFVNHLLLLRDPSPLHELDFCTYTYMVQLQKPLLLFAFNDGVEPFRYVELWIRYAVMRDVRVLRVHVRAMQKPLLLVNVPLISQHLTTLELWRVELDNRALDFSSCPALEDLDMHDCRISAHKMSSQSLKRLYVDWCDFTCDFRTQISAPGLVSLRLSDNRGMTPLLESMPLLVTAFVRLGFNCTDRGWYSHYRDCSFNPCVDCYGNHDGSDKCVLLSGLSNATNLELTAEGEVRISKRDLACCPTFSKLKTLLLNAWVVGRDFRALVCFLRHTPILEKLTLQLHEGHEHMVKMEESRFPVEQLLQSEHLKIVEVRCPKFDEWVHKVSKILNTYGISPDKITIQITESPSVFGASCATKNSQLSSEANVALWMHKGLLYERNSLLYMSKHKLNVNLKSYMLDWWWRK